MNSNLIFAVEGLVTQMLMCYVYARAKEFRCDPTPVKAHQICKYMQV